MAMTGDTKVMQQGRGGDSGIFYQTIHVVFVWSVNAKMIIFDTFRLSQCNVKYYTNMELVYITLTRYIFISINHRYLCLTLLRCFTKCQPSALQLQKVRNL